MKKLSGENVANVEEEPDLPVGVSIEGLRKVFKVSGFRINNKYIEQPMFSWMDWDSTLVTIENLNITIYLVCMTFFLFYFFTNCSKHLKHWDYLPTLY